jgi:CheY-like chemotaxis protein/acyl carrier protein
LGREEGEVKQMPKKILVVDDDRYLVEVYRRALAQEGYEVSCTYDGKEGLEVLKANPQVDLIVLDLKMPKMTGDEFLKVIRGDPTLKDAKVLVMSSYLYRYKEIPGHEDLAGAFGRHSYMREDGLTRIGKKAEDTQPTEMQEKTEQRLKPTGWGPTFGVMPESQADFERNVSQDLLKRVKGIFGEPYVPKKEKRQRGIMPPIPKTLIPERVRELVAECLKVDKEKLSHSTDFDKDLKVCYISQRRLRRRINKEFGIKMSFLEQRDIDTVGDLILVVEHTKQFSGYEREKERREFWKEWGPIAYVWIIFTLIGLGMLVWELVIKKYFIK